MYNTLLHNFRLKVKEYYGLLLIILLGLFLRIFFSIGHIFSDDAYYSYLSYTFLNGHFAEDYLGYPVFLIRLGHIGITSLSFYFSGLTVNATIIPQLLFSLFNIYLTYWIALLIFNQKNLALISAFFIAILPTEVVFATLNFSDSSNILLINSGIFFMLKSIKENKIKFSILAGNLFSLSLLFKEYLIYYLVILFTYFIWLIIKEKSKAKFVGNAIIIVIIFLFLEGMIYLILKNNFLYRLSIIEANYKFSYYDFYPFKSFGSTANPNDLLLVIKQIFMVNLPSIFVRRYYLFLPALALLSSIMFIKKNQHYILSMWFILLCFLLITFSISFSEYKPLDLTRNWYAFPLFVPASILASSILMLINLKWRLIILFLFLIFSINMNYHYLEFFNKSDYSEFVRKYNELEGGKIYTDHFSKYSFDLLDNYSGKKSVEIYKGQKLKKGDILIFGNERTEELKMQGFNYNFDSVVKAQNLKNLFKLKNFTCYVNSH